ncbi:hypothetical protein BCF55_0398 [Hydrogenivirga caldilitoris]|uniref:Uncharacterized protein n=1 Tax=Hydrogenivirga caldilitoris TaxID=246264 RepID=A0A497XPB1_9AQUI|nr:hypothetical protein [Hydrogenivirga caldilitoris]RLJ70134.1 hypothetical protein BCF55_0398 [Hydrogenivirga caldilitoris]
MNEVQSMEDRVVVIVEEFFKDIDKKEPFETELMDFRLRLRAKLLEVITAFPTEPDVANRSLDYALDGIERVIKKEIDQINLESEEVLYRTIKTFQIMNEVLKEFMQEDRVKDKRRLSSITGFIGNTVEKLKSEYKKRFSGFLTSLKRLFGLGRSL